MIYSIPKFINKLSVNQNEVTGQKKRIWVVAHEPTIRKVQDQITQAEAVTRSPQVKQQLFEHSPTISFEIQKGFIR